VAQEGFAPDREPVLLGKVVGREYETVGLGEGLGRRGDQGSELVQRARGRGRRKFLIAQWRSAAAAGKTTTVAAIRGYSRESFFQDCPIGCVRVERSPLGLSLVGNTRFNSTIEYLRVRIAVPLQPRPPRLRRLVLVQPTDRCKHWGFPS
jgi:hypothetical protein